MLGRGTRSKTRCPGVDPRAPWRVCDAGEYNRAVRRSTRSFSAVLIAGGKSVRGWSTEKEDLGLLITAIHESHAPECTLIDRMDCYATVWHIRRGANFGPRVMRLGDSVVVPPRVWSTNHLENRGRMMVHVRLCWCCLSLRCNIGAGGRMSQGNDADTQILCIDMALSTDERGRALGGFLGGSHATPLRTVHGALCPTSIDSADD